MSKMRLDSIHMYRVHNIPQQIRRKMDINTSASALNDVATAISQAGVDAPGAASFKGLLSDVATYDTTSTGHEVPLINIGTDNDQSYFNEKSHIYNFVAVVTVNPINETCSTEERCIIVGYTSEVESSFGGFLPPETKLFINDIYGLRVSYNYSATGQRTMRENGLSIIDNHVLANALPATIGTMPESYVLPDNMMGIAEMKKKYGLSDSEHLQHTAEFREVPQCVAAKMVSPESFALYATGGYLNGLQAESEMDPSFQTWGNTTASHTSQFFVDKRLSTSLSSQKFVRVLRDQLTSSGFAVRSNETTADGSFTLQDLSVAIGNPGDMDRMVAESVQISEQSLGGEVYSDSWDTSSPASITAYDIANRLSEVMSKHLIGEIRFQFTNMDYVDGNLGTVAIVPESVRTLERNGNVPRVLLQRFKQMLELSVFAIVTKNNMVPMRVDVSSALGGATRIEIFVDGAPSVEKYTFASFMSGRLNTTTTSDRQYVQSLASKLGNFTKSVNEGFEEFTRNEAKLNVFSSAEPAPVDTIFGEDSLFGSQSNEAANPADKLIF